MMLVGPGGVGKTRLVTRVATVERSFPARPVVAELGALPDPALADGRPMAVTAVKKAMDAAGHDWPTVRRAAGRLGILKATHPARGWVRHRGLGSGRYPPCLTSTN
jgi:hypothetical protein